MIVTIAAWLYIVNAVLMLGSLLLSPFGFNGIAGLASLALAGLFGAIGFGLLKRLAWARWLALGSSLLGWLLGSVLLVILIAYLLLAAPAAAFLSTMLAGGVFSFVGVMLFAIVLVWVVGIVINYKLFWHLCSEEGCEEFGVPHGSTQTVVASCGAWIAIFILNGVVSGGGQSMSALMGSGGEDASQAEGSAETEDETQARLEEEARWARIERANAILRERAEIEAAATAEAIAAAKQQAEPAGDYPIEESPVPVMESVPEETEDESPTRIVKCVDASGSTIFTQGYCPPGSKPVRTPAHQ